MAVCSVELQRTSFQTIRNNKNNHGSPDLRSLCSAPGPEPSSVCNQPSRPVKRAQCKSPCKPIGTQSPISGGKPQARGPQAFVVRPASFSTPPSCHPRWGASWRSDVAVVWKIAVPGRGENPLGSNTLLPKPRPGLSFTKCTDLGCPFTRTQGLGSPDSEMGLPIPKPGGADGASENTREVSGPVSDPE